MGEDRRCTLVLLNRPGQAFPMCLRLDLWTQHFLAALLGQAEVGRWGATEELQHERSVVGRGRHQHRGGPLPGDALRGFRAAGGCDVLTWKTFAVLVVRLGNGPD